jgi:hypothetical protein
LAVFALLTPIAQDSRAGLQYSQSCGCSQNSSGGSCSGTMAAFKNSSDANAYAEFYESATSGGISRFFGAEFGGTGYWCDASSVANIGTMWPGITANMQNVYFSVQWNASNQCTQLTIYSFSAYY